MNRPSQRMIVPFGVVLFAGVLGAAYLSFVPREPLHEAIQRNDVARVLALLTAGADANAPSRWGNYDDRRPIYTRILAAVQHRDIGEYPNFGEWGDVSIRWLPGDTPLGMAVGADGVALVEALLKAGAEVNQPAHGSMPVFGAKSPGVLDLLIAAGARVDLHRDGRSLLYEWVQSDHGSLEMMRTLLRCNADVNLKNSDGETPLFAACRDRSEAGGEKVRLLLSAGADVHVRHRGGITPLHVAALMGNAVVPMLIESGADVRARDGSGEEPLHKAAFGGNLPAVRDLVTAGAAIDSVDGDGQTPLHEAYWGGRTDVIEFLLSRGSDPTIRDKRGRIPSELGLSR